MSRLNFYQLVTAVLAGCVVSISWLWEPWFIAIWFAMIWQMSSVSRASRAASIFQTWLFGVVALSLSFHWAVGSLAYTLDAEESDVLPRAVFAGLILWESVPFAVLGWLLAVQHLKYQVLWLAPTAWIAIERFWPKVFPWSWAHSQTRFLEMLQVAEIGGVYLVSFVFLYACIGLASQLRSEDRRAYRREAAISLVLLLGTLGYGSMRLAMLGPAASAESIKVGVVQVDPAYGDATEKMRKASDAMTGVDLFVWPESSLGAYVTTVTSLDDIKEDISIAKLPFIKTEYAQHLSANLLVGGRAFLPGAPEEGPYWQTAYLIDRLGGIQGRYYKRHLIPIGEYMPFEQRYPALHDWAQLPDYMASGKSDAPLKLPDGPAVGVLICYEDLIEDAARKTTLQGAKLLVGMINASAFESPAALDQHRRLALFRAIENRRYLVRCAGTGISCVISQTGEQLQRIPPLVEGSFSQEVPILSTVTPYQAGGFLLPWLGVAVVLGWLVLAQPRIENDF